MNKGDNNVSNNSSLTVNSFALYTNNLKNSVWASINNPKNNISNHSTNNLKSSLDKAFMDKFQ